MKPPANGSSVGSILLTVNYANSGNIHYRVKASFTVSAADGMPAGTSATDATMVLPGYSRDLSVNWTPQAVLSPGSYSISARVTLEDGTVLGQATAQFELPPPVPSTPPASPTPTPSYTPTQAPSSSTTPVVSSPPVTPAQPGKTNWGLIIGGIGGAGALAVGMFLFGVRRGRRGR